MARKIATNAHVDREALLEFVRSRHRMILITQRPDGTPQASPVTGGVDDSGRIVISTYPERAKTRNARNRPDVSVLVISDEWNDPWVQVDGTADVNEGHSQILIMLSQLACSPLATLVNNIYRLRITAAASGCSVAMDAEHYLQEGQDMNAVTDATFNNDVLMIDKPVLVHFWATWNGGCRMVRPILQEIANEHGDTLSIVEMNIDENPKTPRTYGIMQIPTMNVYQDGQVVRQIVGAKPKAALLHDLAEFL